MKNRKTLCAFLLTGAMVLGMGTSVFADGEATNNVPTIGGVGTEQSPAEPTITKRLELADGITVPDMTFKFNVTAVTQGAPAASIGDISFSNSDSKGNLTDRKYAIEKQMKITFGAFPHAGQYEYTVTEQSDTYTPSTDGKDSVAYSNDSYTLLVNVANGSNDNLYVQSVTAKKENVKQDKILFTNTYTKTTSLTISKITTGDLADKTKDFDFKITFMKAGTDDTGTFTGKIGDETVTCQTGVAQDFKLHDNEKLVFENIPAGTHYKVEEVGALDGYTPSVSVVENGTQTVNGKTENGNGTGVTSEPDGKEHCLAGEGENKVEFTNTYREVALTGVIMNNLPFLLLIGVGVCALGLLAFSKKRRTANR